MASPSDSAGNVDSSGTGPGSYYDNTVKFNPTTAVVIIVLIGGCFVLAFISVFLRRCMIEEHATSTQSSTTQYGSYVTKTRGLEKAAVDALPLVHCKDLDAKDDRECPVCLTEFEPEDILRLLPACKHVFHQECIDAWFDSHSTCPLCRASLLGEPAGDDGEQVVLRDPVETITEVSEHGDSDLESPRTTATPLEDSQTASPTAPPQSAMISGDGERTILRETLSRNSESFKRAARGVAAYEKGVAAAAAAQSLNKNISFRKPPSTPASTTPSIRRSSSLGTDLISLRNLLLGSEHGVNATDASPSWFTRARSMDRAPQRDDPKENATDDWVTIDLEAGKANSAHEPPSSSTRGESSKGPAAPERAWSGRWSLAGLKGAMKFPLSRSTSDISSRAAHLPV